MEKSEQTQQVKERLYYLTAQFVKKYIHRYYKQFKGDIYDLITEYYIQFETPKSRERGKEQTLLDKFDPSITTLEYLVKVSVQRKLIDSSRHDCRQSISFDKKYDEFGDMMCKVFDLVTEPEEIESDVISHTEFSILCERFSRLSKDAQESIFVQYSEVRSVLSKTYQTVFDRIFNFREKTIEVVKKIVMQPVSVIYNETVIEAPCQQVTPKTICLKIENAVYDFDRVTGHSRGKRIVAQISQDSLNWIAENITTYHSGISRFEF